MGHRWWEQERLVTNKPEPNLRPSLRPSLHPSLHRPRGTFIRRSQLLLEKRGRRSRSSRRWEEEQEQWRARCCVGSSRSAPYPHPIPTGSLNGISQRDLPGISQRDLHAQRSLHVELIELNFEDGLALHRFSVQRAHCSQLRGRRHVHGQARVWPRSMGRWGAKGRCGGGIRRLAEVRQLTGVKWWVGPGDAVDEQSPRVPIVMFFASAALNK